MRVVSNNTPTYICDRCAFRQFKEGVASTLGAGDAQAHFDLAQAYREMGLLKDALEMIDKVLAIDPSWRDADVIRAELIEQLKKG